MLVVFQHPVIDFRYIIENNCKLPTPIWPLPEEKRMMKYIGNTAKRLKGGTTYWGGEQKFCTTRSAIQFIDLEKHRIKLDTNLFLKTECAFRRINSNGNFSVKYETGLRNSLDEFTNKFSMSNSDFESILLEYCKIEVNIKNPFGGNILTEIINCGKHLSDLYLYSTSSHTDRINNKIQKWWTMPGEPLIIVEYNDNDNVVKLPHNVKLICKYNEPKIELYHYWTKVYKGKILTNTVRSWIIKILESDGNYYDYDFVRELRLNLLRINAEKETLRNILYLLQRKGNELVNSQESKIIVSNYLEKISCKLLKEVRHGINQADILDYALMAEEKAIPGELESYLDTLAPLKNKYIISNVKQFADKGFTINVMEGGKIDQLNVTEKGNILNYGN